MIEWFCALCNLTEISNKVHQLESSLRVMNKKAFSPYAEPPGVKVRVPFGPEPITVPLDDLLEAILLKMNVEVVPTFMQPRVKTKLVDKAEV